MVDNELSYPEGNFISILSPSMIKHIKLDNSTKVTAVSNNLGYDDAETEKSEETADTKNNADKSKLTWPLFMYLNRTLFSVVIPAFTSQWLLGFMETSIAILFVGFMNNSKATAGVGLAIIFVNLTTFSTLMGLNSTISVLVPVSFGQKDYQECERVLQRGRILCIIF